MTQVELEYNSGSSKSGVTAGMLVGAALGNKSSGRAINRALFSNSKRTYKKKKTAWICDECSGKASQRRKKEAALERKTEKERRAQQRKLEKAEASGIRKDEQARQAQRRKSNRTENAIRKTEEFSGQEISGQILTEISSKPIANDQSALGRSGVKNLSSASGLGNTPNVARGRAPFDHSTVKSGLWLRLLGRAILELLAVGALIFAGTIITSLFYPNAIETGATIFLLFVLLGPLGAIGLFLLRLSKKKKGAKTGN